MGKKSAPPSATERKANCPECGKELRDARGVFGHLWLIHGIKLPSKEQRLLSQIDQLKTELAERDEEISGLKEGNDEHQEDNLPALQRVYRA